MPIKSLKTVSKVKLYTLLTLTAHDKRKDFHLPFRKLYHYHYSKTYINEQNDLSFSRLKVVQNVNNCREAAPDIASHELTSMSPEFLTC